MELEAIYIYMRSLGVENVVAIVSVTSYLVYGFPAKNHNETTAGITGIKLRKHAVLSFD